MRASFAGTLLSFGLLASVAAQDLNVVNARDIARDALLWAYPMLQNHQDAQRFMAKNPGTWNQFVHMDRPALVVDKHLRNANVDYPTSTMYLDLRNEPYVIFVPKSDAKTQFSLQFTDWTGQLVANLGSRNAAKGGAYIVAGPDWDGSNPPGIEGVVRLETSLGVAHLRALVESGDKAGAKKIQSGFKVQRLSVYAARKTPKTYGPLTLAALDMSKAQTPEGAFAMVADELGFAPVAAPEKARRADFAKLGLASGKKFSLTAFAPELQSAIKGGVDEAWLLLGDNPKLGEVEGLLVGTRDEVKGGLLQRARFSKWGQYAAEAKESLELPMTTDGDGRTLDASRKRYTLKLKPEQLPPAQHWSITVYDKNGFLADRGNHKFSVDAKSFAKFPKSSDGSVTLYLQQDTPAPDLEPNWIPIPDSTFSVVLRLYRPAPEALNGTWKPTGLRSFPK